jgi:hypothetical protein
MMRLRLRDMQRWLDRWGWRDMISRLDIWRMGRLTMWRLSLMRI